MTGTTRFCRQCDREVSVTGYLDSCPECGSSPNDVTMPDTLQLDSNASQVPVSQQKSKRESELRAADSLVGRQLGQYQIERFLGRGGMADVFLARHLTLERPCALKILRSEDSRKVPNQLDAFLAEARTAASLVHPHIVTLHNIGNVKHLHFIEMEYVEGDSLAHHLSRAGAIDPLKATQWMLHISAALSAAHQLKLIHRDIKPANVLVTRSGNCKLADFGLAKRLANVERIQGLSGTLNFMAPELFAGQPATTRSDIYAMGITYYSLLAGKMPVNAHSVSEILSFHQQREPIEVEETFAHLPDAVREVLSRSLNCDVEQRYADAEELRSTLQEIYGSLQPLGMLVEKALVDIDHFYNETQNSEQHISTNIALESGRKQNVQIELTNDKETGEELVRVFSICGPADSEYFERALQLNASISHGSIAIQSIDGAPHFVMTYAYPRATCDPQEVRFSVLDIARHSDEIERLLADEDRY